MYHWMCHRVYVETCEHGIVVGNRMTVEDSLVFSLFMSEVCQVAIATGGRLANLQPVVRVSIAS